MAHRGAGGGPMFGRTTNQGVESMNHANLDTRRESDLMASVFKLLLDSLQPVQRPTYHIIVMAVTLISPPLEPRTWMKSVRGRRSVPQARSIARTLLGTCVVLMVHRYSSVKCRTTKPSVSVACLTSQASSVSTSYFLARNLDIVRRMLPGCIPPCANRNVEEAVSRGIALSMFRSEQFSSLGPRTRTCTCLFVLQADREGSPRNLLARRRRNLLLAVARGVRARSQGVLVELFVTTRQARRARDDADDKECKNEYDERVDEEEAKTSNNIDVLVATKPPRKKRKVKSSSDSD